MPKESDKTKNSYFFYDGSCSFCTKMARRLQAFCLDSEVEFLNFREYNEDELKGFHPSLGVLVASGNVQFVTKGKRYPGFFAIRKISHRLKTYRLFSVLLYLPLVPFLGMLVLALLKKIRHKIE